VSESTRKLRQLRRHRNKPPFLTESEIKDLALRLRTSQFVVATILLIAGHVLRARYRRRGWLPVGRGEGDNRVDGAARADVHEAVHEVLTAEGWALDGEQAG
jgi:hypothetical protein